MHKIKQIILYLIGKRHKMLWKYDIKQISRHKQGDKERLPYFVGKQLFLVPHADDDLLAGYALAKQQGCSLRMGYYGMTGSTQDVNNKKTRNKEFEKYISEMKLGHYKINSFNDILDIVKKDSVKVIYLPSLIDWHPEHRKVNYDLYDALSFIDGKWLEGMRIIWYSITVPIECRNKVIVPMSEEQQKEKYQLFMQIYHSQLHMPLQRFKYQEQINAMGSGSYAAEVFMQLTIDIWKRCVESMRTDEPDHGTINEYNMLKAEINSIKRIRLKSKKYYEDLLQV